MAGKDRRHNPHKKKAIIRENSNMLARFMSMIGLADHEAFVPKLKHRGSKHEPHQGAAEKAKRRSQIANGLLSYENGFRSNDCVVGSPTGDKVFDSPQQAMFYLEADNA